MARPARIVAWIARVLGILFALFLGVFSLDSQSVPVFLIHNIPSVIILAAVVVGWRWPGVGGVMFVVLAAAATFFFRTYRLPVALLLISGPFVVVGVLFLVQWWLGRRGGAPASGQGQAPVIP